MEHATLSYEGFDPAAEGLREALCTLGNGYVATRGAAPESHADDVHYPGTYFAGCYDRLTSTVAGRTVENEDLVNAPNWLPLTFSTPGQGWLGLTVEQVLDHRQDLDIRRGVLTRRTRFRDALGRVLAVTQRRLVSMHDPHVAALETTFVAENWSGPLEVRASLDGRVTNSGVARYRDLDGRHVVPVAEGYDKDERVAWLEVRTATSQIRIAQAMTVTVTDRTASVTTTFEYRAGEPAVRLWPDLVEGIPVTLEKRVAMYTSRDRAISEPLDAARRHAARLPSFEELLADHVRAWDRLWQESAVVVPGEVQQALELHVFHLLQVLSEHTAQLDVGMPARGLHGEAYRGHVFWDELFVFPFLLLRLPHVARSLLMYRWRRLPQARRAASDAGHRGAMYPWQSGSDGREETQRMHLNPASGRWLEDHTDLQRHVGIAVAHNVWQYYEATEDLEFMREHGIELLVEIARFWCSLSTYDAGSDRYDIRGVVGPDEYHDRYPDADLPGIDNNAYTNVMVTRVLRHTLDALALLPAQEQDVMRMRLRLDERETDLFDHVSRRMRVVFHDGVISQFEGYGELMELDWPTYRSRYGNIRRLDRILEAEDDSVNRYQVSKQADVLMLVFLLGGDGVCKALGSLGYELDHATLDRTVDYYLARTSHGSTLSAVVHAWVLASRDRSASWRYFREALDSDIADVQGGTTAEGIHLGAMAGTIDLVQRCYTGLALTDGVLRLDPRLPAELDALELRLRFRDHRGVTVRCDHDGARISLARSRQRPIIVALDGGEHVLAPGQTWVVRWTVPEEPKSWKT